MTSKPTYEYIETIAGRLIYLETFSNRFILSRSPHGPILGNFPSLKMAQETANQLPTGRH
jgi:hypothetical protein